MLIPSNSSALFIVNVVPNLITIFLFVCTCIRTHVCTYSQETSSGNVFGVIHFINKGFNEETFGEADEFYATVFASQVSEK